MINEGVYVPTAISLDSSYDECRVVLLWEVGTAIQHLSLQSQIELLIETH